MVETRRQPATAFTRMQLGQILLAMREAGIKDAAELARALDLEAQTVYKWFTQERGASLEVRERLAALLSMPLDDLRATTQTRNRPTTDRTEDMRALVREELARLLRVNEPPPDATQDNSQRSGEAAHLAPETTDSQHSTSGIRHDGVERIVPLPPALVPAYGWGATG